MTTQPDYVYVASSWRNMMQPTGAGKRTAILTRNGEEPELMAKMVDHIATSLDELLAWLRGDS